MDEALGRDHTEFIKFIIYTSYFIHIQSFIVDTVYSVQFVPCTVYGVKSVQCAVYSLSGTGLCSVNYSFIT